MTIPVFFFIALAIAIFSYSQGQGGPVAGLVFFGVLFIGVLVHVMRPGAGEATQPVRDGSPGE